ncbi:MAG: ABC transporter ATP-binding protein [Gammaproteobacteria bacterium]
MLQVVRQLYGMLEPSERWRFIWVLVTVLMMALLEVVGVGAIFPFMNMIANPGFIQENKWLSAAYRALNFNDTHQFVLFAGFVLLGIFTLKSAFSIFATWLQLRFVWGNFYRLSKRLVRTYLYRPYPYFFNVNVSELQKNVLNEVTNVTLGVFVPVMHLITHSLVAVFIFLLLFQTDPVLTLVVISVLGGPYAIVYFWARPTLARIGTERLGHNKMRFKIFAEAFGGIKEVKAFCKEEYFLDRFNVPLGRLRDNTITGQLISSSPKFAIEAIAFGGIVGIVLYTVGTHQDMAQVIPVISLYAMAGYRTLPALQQIMQSLAQLRVNQPTLTSITRSVDEGADYLRVPSRQQAADIILRQEIRLCNVRYQFPGKERPAIEGLNLTIPRNTVVGFVGSSGAGKSTAADIILGLLKPEAGNLYVDDTMITPENVVSWQQHIGYVPQHAYLLDESVTRNIAFGVRDQEIDAKAVEQAARAANIYDFITRELPEGFETILGDKGVRLSGGQRQRIAIARALFHNPDVVILDEATSALDGVTEAIVSQSIRELGGKKTLIIIAHRLTTVRDCHVIYVFDQGNIVSAGTYEELVRSCDKFRDLVSATAG